MRTTGSNNSLGRLTEWVLARRRATFALWAVLFLAGAFAASQVSHRLSLDFSLPGQPGYETALKLERVYGNGGEQAPSLLVVTAPAGTDLRTHPRAIDAAFAAVRHTQRQLRIADFGATRDSRFFSRDGRTAFALAFTPQPKSFGASPATGGAARVLERTLPAGYLVQTTGLNELSNGSGGGGPGVLVETLLGASGALAVLAFVFSSLLALVPLLVAAVSIVSTMLVIFALSFVAEVSFIVQFLVALIGLGVAIDYSLLLVTRWREERDRGRTNAEAIVTAVATAGRAVLLSGITVAIGLLALVVLPVPGLRSVGYAGVLIPVVSVAVTLTLLPALLGAIGPRVDWGRVRQEARVSRTWTRWAAFVVARRFPAAVLGLAVLVVLCLPVFHLTTGETSASALAKTGSAHAAYQRLLAGGVPNGVFTPLEVMVRRDRASQIRARLAAVPGIVSAVVSAAPDSNRDGTSVVLGIPQTETVNNSTLAPVRAARKTVDKLPGVVGITGVGAIELDYEHAVFGSFPLMFAVISLLTFLLLARAFRSLLLAAKALVFNLLSIAATFGAMTWAWQEGHLSDAIFGVPATGAITYWIPLMIFAFLFGLSMDYEVFILARVREEYDRTGSTTRAIVEGVGRTGRLVTSAALILFLAFASLASAPNTDIKVLATGLGVGILLDATIVRALLLPAFVAILGRWNWWLPKPAARFLRAPDSTPALEAP
jgi:RND superfamily putative drug exporter